MAVIRKFEKTPDEESKSPRVLKSLKRKAKYSKSHDESNWLISYADMMTLLCVFYIMMFSMSKVNTQEFEKVKQQVAEHFGSKYESPTADLGKFVTQVVQENGVAKDVMIASDGVGVTLAFHSTLFFNSMSAEISDEGHLLIDRLAHGLYQQQVKIGKNYKIVVEGHTDAQPILGGPFPSNWELSSARATRVIRLFLEDGFDAQNLLAIGYSDTKPLADSKNPDGSWNLENLAKNRRVIIRVLMPDVDSIPWSGKPAVEATQALPTKPMKADTH
jgi:chemotaxis protein MotB